MFFIYKIQCYPRFINYIPLQEYLDHSGALNIFSMCFSVCLRRVTQTQGCVSLVRRLLDAEGGCHWPPIKTFMFKLSAFHLALWKISCLSHRGLQLFILYPLFFRVPSSSTSDAHWKQTASERHAILMDAVLTFSNCSRAFPVLLLEPAAHVGSAFGSARGFHLILTSFSPWLSSWDKSQGSKRKKKEVKRKDATGLAFHNLKMCTNCHSSNCWSSQTQVYNGCPWEQYLLNPVHLPTPSARSGFFNSIHLSMAIVGSNPKKRIPWEAPGWGTPMPMLSMGDKSWLVKNKK